VKKARRHRATERLKGPWINVLAVLAAEARLDGGQGLQLLVQHAKFDVRPRLSLAKHTADDTVHSLSHKAA
jgi:hypothetical protein